MTSEAKNDTRVRVGLVEDDVLFRRYVAGVLDATGRYRVVAEATTAAEARGWPDAAAPAVAFVDIALPDDSGNAVVADLLARFPQLAVVMLTARDEESLILEAIRAGAGGYVLKAMDSAGLVAVLDDVRAGGAPMSPAIARKVVGLMRNPAAAAATAAPRPADVALEGLTPRETEVLALVAAGEADKEVAARLGISLSVVKAHLGKIYAKWRVRSRTEAAIKFTRQRKI
ncbi:MAG: response regulator transcription factor [Verrucomicrobia bacterium]|nr:response regulator transcription factor [Verrucomicrobiota bacterium]